MKAIEGDFLIIFIWKSDRKVKFGIVPNGSIVREIGR